MSNLLRRFRELAGSDRHHGHHVPDDFPAPVRALAAVSRVLAVLEGLGIGVSLAALIVLALWQLVTRNLRMHGFPQFPAAPEWSDNVLRHAVFLIGFLGAMYATFTARHLRVDAVTRLASVRGRMIMRVVAAAGAIAVCVYSIHAAWEYRTGVLEESVMEGTIFTPARGAMIIVAGMAGMILHFVVQMIIDVTYLATRHEVPGFWIHEASHGGEIEVAPDASLAGDAEAAGSSTTTGAR